MGTAATAGILPLTTPQSCTYRPGIKCVQANACPCQAANCPFTSGLSSENFLQIKLWQDISISNIRLSALSSAVSPLKVEIIYSVLISFILLICSLKNNYICSYTSKCIHFYFSYYSGFEVISSHVILTKFIVSNYSDVYLLSCFINKNKASVKFTQYKK